MNFGYMGKILWIDLSKRKTWEEVLPAEIYRNYLSGIGLGAYILYNRVPKKADPLGPENVLGFVSGLLTGTKTLFTGRWVAISKSPLTGGFGESNCGGTLSPMIKRCGYDGIFIIGQSEKPVYIYVREGQTEIRDASDVWGKDAVESEKLLLKDLNDKQARAAVIGQGGEKLSLISVIVNDRGRTAARSGLGAVMGSKKLKALVVSGKTPILVNDIELVKKLSKPLIEYVKKKIPIKLSGNILAYVGRLMRWLPFQNTVDDLIIKIGLQEWGTVFQNQFSLEIGDSPVKNWAGSVIDYDLNQSETINADRFRERQIRPYHCFACPLGCGGICSINEEFKEAHKPEYETVMALGPMLLNNDLDKIFYWNEILNRAGLDIISVGGTIAFAIECFEKGIITLEDTGKLSLKWGDTDTIEKIIFQMIKREGFGGILADGVCAASKKFGFSAQPFAIHAGGQELPMHDPRNDPGYAIHYSADPSPGKDNTGSQVAYERYQLWTKIKTLPKPQMLYWKTSKYSVDKVKAICAAACSDYMNIVNSCGICRFAITFGCSRIPIFEWINAVTGWEKSPEDYMHIGRRIQHIKQAFNIRQDITPKQFIMNSRASGIPPQTDGANAGRVVYTEALVKEYWATYGWNSTTGIPDKSTLEKFGIDSI